MLKKLGIESSMAGVSAHVGGGTIVGIIVAAACIAVVAGYAVHKLRLRRLMQSEIQSIMYVTVFTPFLFKMLSI